MVHKILLSLWNIARNIGLFEPTIFGSAVALKTTKIKMASQGEKRTINRISYKMLHNLSSLDIEAPTKKTKRYHGKSLGIYEAERLIGRKQNGEVRDV